MGTFMSKCDSSALNYGKSAMKMEHSPAKMGYDSPAKKESDPNKAGSKQMTDIKSSVKSFSDKVGAKPDFKNAAGVKDLKITDPIKGKSSRRKGTGTTASGDVLFPGYSSKSVGTYEKNYQTYNKIRPGAEAKSFGNYAKLKNKVSKDKQNRRFETTSQKTGSGRIKGTFKTMPPQVAEGRQAVNTEYGNNFGGKSRAIYGSESQGFKSGGRAEEAFGKMRAKRAGR